MSNTYPIDFTVTDYIGSTTSLSSYNLSITPLVFTASSVPIIGERTKLVWDFGDGTRLDALAPVHTYTTAGVYTVTLTYYDCIRQGIISSITKNIQILNYIDDTFNIHVNGNTLLSYTGRLSNPITITQYIPVNIVDTTIVYTVKGSASSNYFFLKSSKYNHLKPYNALLQASYSSAISGYELIEVEAINISLSPIYVQLSGSVIVHTNDAINSIIAGYSGTDVFYYRDDLPCDSFNIEFNKRVVNAQNTLNITLDGSVNQSLFYNLPDNGGLTISSNGIDGDNIPNSVFNISNIKLSNTAIPFIVKLKGYDGNITIKNTQQLQLSSNIGGNKINVSVYQVLSTSELIPVLSSFYTINSLQDTLTSYGLSGCFRGYVEFTGITEPTQYCLSAVCSGVQAATQTSGRLQNISNTFTVYPKDYYTLYKKNENFDAEGMFKSLRIQESLQDKDLFFEKFLGTIFGNQLPDSDALGKKVYERIANFVDNNVNINTAEIIRLVALGNLIDNKSTVFSNTLISYPDKMQKLISLLSINKNNLFGYKNQFVENFDDRGFADKDVYGANLGVEIPITDDIDTTTRYIVAYEKFSKRYILLNTIQPLMYTLLGTGLYTESELELLTEDQLSLFAEGIYRIEQYETGWGWPLLLPDNFTSVDISKYYIFYTYIDTPAGDIVGNVIDFDVSSINFDTTRKELVEDDGIFERIILNTLYQSLSLTK